MQGSNIQSSRKMKNNTYYPFTLSEHEGISSLLLTDMKWGAFEKEGFLGSGHDWNRLIRNLVKDKFPNRLKMLDFDSEADMFCVKSHNKEPLEKIVNLVSLFYDDENKLIENISKYAQYS